MLTEITKLEAARAIRLLAALFDGVSPKAVTAWRARAAVEAPSHRLTPLFTSHISPYGEINLKHGQPAHAVQPPPISDRPQPEQPRGDPESNEGHQLCR
jgi:hypothetical protein